MKNSKNEMLLIVSLYMDDLLITGNSNELLAKFKKWMQNMFKMT